MKVLQHVSFVLESQRMTAAEIERRVGLEPDDVGVRGSRTAVPPRPVHHRWEVRCDDPGLRIDAQAEQVIGRLESHRAAIRNLVDESDDVEAALVAVRYLNVRLALADGEDEELTITASALEKLPGQHQLLGSRFDASTLGFLVDVRAELMFDEYG
jgi:Domain of unknown function (DUF4279)